jgi:hypothetical protein
MGALIRDRGEALIVPRNTNATRTELASFLLAWPADCAAGADRSHRLCVNKGQHDDSSSASVATLSAVEH